MVTMHNHIKELWVNPFDCGGFKKIYVCDCCGEIAFYWTDDILKHPAQNNEEYEEWYKYHKPYCANNIQIRKVDDGK